MRSVINGIPDGVGYIFITFVAIGNCPDAHNLYVIGNAHHAEIIGTVGTNDACYVVASFSNYGLKTVDVFAPGKDIYSTVPGSKYAPNSGTSMASPVVAGVAAVLKSYFPKLTYADIKRIITESSTHYAVKVPRPGSETSVDFSTLSKTGGVVNLYDAVKMALAQEGGDKKAK